MPCSQQSNGESHHTERIQNGVPLGKDQAGFRKNKSTIDKILILQNIIEEINEWQATFYAHFVDFEEAFDSVHREASDCGES